LSFHNAPTGVTGDRPEACTEMQIQHTHGICWLSGPNKPLEINMAQHCAAPSNLLTVPGFFIFDMCQNHIKGFDQSNKDLQLYISPKKAIKIFFLKIF